jgi:uncharacterized membrane protein
MPHPNEPDTTGRTVVGLFNDRRHAEAAIRDLKAAGFTEEQIGVAWQSTEGEAHIVGDSQVGEAGQTQSGEFAAKGAVSGGVLGGLVGLLGSLLIPGFGPVVVGGVLASTLTGAGLGAAAGGIIGALTGMGVSEQDAQHFDLGLRAGGTLVAVGAGNRTDEALAILQRHGIDFGPSRRDRVERRETSPSTVGDVGSLGESVVPDVGASVGDVASGSSTGTRGFPSRKPYGGRERRTRRNTDYTGPERRAIGV